MAQSLVLSIEVCRGLGISPLRIKHLAEFSPADLRPTSGQERFFFHFFLSHFGTFVLKICAHSERYRNLMPGIYFKKKICAHSERYINLMPVIFQKSHFFLWQHRVSTSSSLTT